MNRIVACLGILVTVMHGAFAQESRPEVPYQAGKVPPFGELRYVIHYRAITDDFREFCVKSKINFVHWHGPFCGYTGLPPRESFDKLNAEVKKNVEWAHKNGMVIILYIGPNFSYGDPQKRTIIFDFFDKRWDSYADYIGPKPDDPMTWTQRDKDGKPRVYKYRGDEGFYFCVNSSAARRYVKGILQIIAETGADGVFYDGPFFQRGCCYCDGCTAAYRRWLPTQIPPAELKEKYGIADPNAAPIPDSKDHPLYPVWRRFFAWSLMEYFADTKAYARKFSPHFLLTGNYWFDGNPYSALIGSAENDELLSKARDVNFCESHYDQGPYTERGRKYSNSIDHQYLVAAAHGTPTTLLKTAAKARTPEAQAVLTKLCIAEGNANLSNWEFHYIQGPSQQAAIDYNAFLARHAHVFRGASRCTNIALWVSMEPAYRGLSTSAIGMARYLTDTHIPYTMIIDEQFTPQTLSDYDAVIIPDVPVVSEKQVAMVEEYVKGGGAALIVGDGELKRLAGSPDKVVHRQLEKGRIVWSPKLALPVVPRDGLNAGQWEQIRGLKDDIAWLLDGNPSARIQSDNMIEMTLMRQPNGDRLIANLVNYEIDLNGNIAEKTDVPVWIMLPTGKTVKKATLLSPDLPDSGKDLSFRIVRPGGRRYATLLVPSLSIYDVVVLDLGPDEQVLAVPPGTQLTVEGDVLAESPRIQLGVASESLAKSELMIEGVEKGEQVDGVPFARRFSAPALKGKPGTATAFLCTARCTAKDGSTFDLNDVFYAKTGPIASFVFESSPHVDVVTKINKLTVTVKNQSALDLSASPSFVLPQGWRVEPNPSEQKLAPNETKMIEFNLVPEANAAPGVYEIAARLEAKAGDRTFDSAVKRQMDLPEKYDVVMVNRTKIWPVIDGKGDDACWADAAAVKGFRKIDGSAPSACETEVRMVYNSTYLYLLFICKEPMMDQFLAKHNHNGANVWEDDSIEIFLDGNHDHAHFGQIVANANGVYYAPQAAPDTCKATREGDRWIVEMDIPLRKLGAAPSPGDVWGFNLCRTRIAKGGEAVEHSAWVPTGESFHAPTKFGHLLFGK